MTETDFIIIAYMAEARDLISEGQAVLARVRAGTRPLSSARLVHDGVLPPIRQARRLAGAAEYAGCRESLEGLADDLEALRGEARLVLNS